MKSILLSVTLLCGASVAHAQLLPVPGAKNPDWVLQQTAKTPYDGQALAPPPATDPMPNGAQKSISSIGDHHYYWDAQRQLSYDWYSRGPATMAPFVLVNVREANKDFVYVYRRAHVNGKLNYLPGQRNPTK
jgi:hypothetical protein